MITSYDNQPLIYLYTFEHNALKYLSIEIFEIDLKNPVDQKYIFNIVQCLKNPQRTIDIGPSERYYYTIPFAVFDGMMKALELEHTNTVDFINNLNS